jgi:hypothetical protein
LLAMRHYRSAAAAESSHCRSPARRRHAQRLLRCAPPRHAMRGEPAETLSPS